MLKPTYKTKGGYLAQDIKITVQIDKDLIERVIQFMILEECPKINKRTIEATLRQELEGHGRNKFDYLSDDYEDAEFEETAQAAEESCRRLFPGFYK